MFKQKSIANYFLMLLMIFSTATFVGCSTESDKEEENPLEYIFDPRQPGKDDNQYSIRGVQNLQWDTSVSGKISFTWEVIPLYNSLNYTIEIYRKRAEGTDEDFDPIDPHLEGGSAFLYLKQAGYTSNSWVDEDVLPDATYIYYFFVKVDDFWSENDPTAITTSPEETEFEMPSPSEFWSYARMTKFGVDPLQPDGVSQKFYFLQSLEMGKSEIGKGQGGVAVAYNGSVMYVADTESNRVVIYAQGQGRAIECVENAAGDEDELFLCRLQFNNMPLEAYNVLGQPKVDTIYNCDDTGALPMNECLEKPTHVVVDDGHLFISDSANDRVVIWNHLPYHGCDPNALFDASRPIDCTPDAVVGRPSLFNTGTNPESGNPISLANDGLSFLDNPGAVTVYQGDLFIPDTGNNRIVVVKEYDNPEVFQCSDENWLTPLCSFHSVLGQRDFNSKETFEDIYNADNGILGGPLNRTVNDPYILMKKFANPTRLRTTSNGKMIVSVNEDFTAASSIGTTVALKGRLLVFDPNILRGESTSCNSVSFDTGGCDVERIIGMEDAENIVLISSASGGAGSYSSISYGLEDVIDFDVEGELLMAVDSINNYIYVWEDWTDETRLGSPYTYRIKNPEGVIEEGYGRSLPDLKSLSSIEIDMIKNDIYVSDSEGNRVYKIKAEDATAGFPF